MIEIPSLIHYWKPALEILILWVIVYHIMLFFEGTRTMQLVRGIIILGVAFLVFERLGLQVLDWLIAKLFGISVIAILVIFHPEIRQGLARLGQRHVFGAPLREKEIDLILREITGAIEYLTNNKIGAIIAIEKVVPLNSYMESGVMLDARISSDLIEAIFTPVNPLHDGAIIIQNGRIMAAGCLFPLTQNQDLSRIFGTRHRAALGLSEVTDAIVIVVSEERRDISLIYKGKLHRDLSQEDLVSRIKDIIKLKK